MIAMHKPFYTSGEHGDDALLIERFRDLLSDGLVEFVVSGHDHDMELQERDANADGAMERFAVSGSAAKLRSISPGPHTLFGASEYGFAELELSAAGATISFFGAGGELLYTR